MRPLRNLLGVGTHDLAVDLGTANTVVYRRGRGVVLFEPSVIAVDEQTGAIQAIGEQAKRMIGRTPATITATRPLRHGVIADFETTEQMLRYFIRRASGGRSRSSRVVVCVPSGVTDVERRAVEEATLAAGARRAALIEEAMAGAIGAGLPVSGASGTMIVDVGGGTTEVAVIALGGMVVWQSLRVGGYELDEAIVRYVRDARKLLIGLEHAERLKLEIGSVVAFPGEASAQVAGRDLLTGLLRRAELDAKEIRTALERPLRQILDAVKETLERTPPELAADIANQGVVLVGGGALLRGIDERLRRETDLPVHIADSPLTSVAVGAGHSLEEWDALARTSSRSPAPRSRRRPPVARRPARR